MNFTNLFTSAVSRIGDYRGSASIRKEAEKGPTFHAEVHPAETYCHFSSIAHWLRLYLFDCAKSLAASDA